MGIQRIYQMRKYCEEHHLFSEGEQVLIGLSGGADSVFLACMMKELAPQLGLELQLVHINHGIRGSEAERDERFCQCLARQLELPITVFRGDVPSLAEKRGMSEEEAGRYYRYECMEGLRQQLGFHKIAVAHHKDDQAETVLFQLLRGSSLQGLGGMCPMKGRIVRPLLVFRRREIEEELRRMGQDWCQDSTNEELIYSRNKLRRQVIPYLEQEVNPGTVEHLARTAEQMRELSDFLVGETEQVYESLIQEREGRLEMEADSFCRLHPVLQRELVMRLFERLVGSRKDISSRHVEGVCRLAAGSTGKRMTFPYEMRAGKDYQMVWLEKKSAERWQRGTQEDMMRPLSEAVWLPGEIGPREYVLTDSYGIPRRIVLEKITCMKNSEQNMGKVLKNVCTKWFDYDKINGMLEFRHPRKGDYFLLDRAGKRKKLSRFLIDGKIALERRKALWILAMGSHVLWIPELGRSSVGFYVTEDTQEILCASYTEDR